MAIQQHPLPQDISSYRFRLIGDMTIKQFASLGISIILALIIYGLPLPFFFKYPLSFLFIVLGVGMAFVPVQGRSLDVWILAFIRSIYSPTQYSWKRTEEVPSDTTVSTTTQPVSNARIELTQGISSAPITPAVTVTPAPVSEPVIAEQKSDQVTPPTPEPTEQIPSPLVIAPKPATEETAAVPTPPAPPTTTEQVASPAIVPPQTQTTPPAQTSTASQLPIPYTPTTPNTLVGLTLTPEGKIMDGVLVEIQKNGLTSRATKSNKLGQFMFARPLENGIYQILAEKQGNVFAPYSIDLTGEIVRPLKIQAQ